MFQNITLAIRICKTASISSPSLWVYLFFYRISDILKKGARFRQVVCIVDVGLSQAFQCALGLFVRIFQPVQTLEQGRNHGLKVGGFQTNFFRPREGEEREGAQVKNGKPKFFSVLSYIYSNSRKPTKKCTGFRSDTNLGNIRGTY